MRSLLPLIALIFGLTTANAAHAGAARWGNHLRFVAETSAPSAGGQMSLCHLVNFADFLFIPVYTRVEGYALSSDGCTGDMYRELSPEHFETMQLAGMIPADIPATPKLDLKSMIWGHILLIIGAVSLVFKGLIAWQGRKTPRRAKNPDSLAIHSLVAMSQVAIADGRIDDSEVHQISSILTRLTGRGYSPEQVMDLLARLNPSANDLAQVGQDLTEGDRQIVLEAALNIAVADGDMHPNEYAVISDLAQRMRINAEDFRHAVARISAHLQTVQPV